MPMRNMTNEEKLVHMMNFSAFGGLKQVFIMTALETYAKQVDQATEKELGNGFISPEVWKGVAKEVLKEMATEMKVPTVCG